MQRRVLHIIDSLHLGGAQEVVLNLATCGSERFHHEVATLHGHGVYWDRLKEAGIRVFSLSPHKYLPLYFASIPWRILCGRYDIVHCHLIPSNIIAKPLAALCGVSVIINHDHTNDSYRTENKLLLAIDRFTNRFASHIIPVSASCRDFLVEYESIEPERITLIPNAIDLRRFTPGSTTKAEARQKLGLKPHVPVLAGVGRLNSQKNFALFLEVAARLAQRFPDLHFLLAGDGPEEKMLRAKASALGIADRVLFSGYVADSRLVYLAADVLLMPSRFEGLPMTLLESMAMGLAVVASRLDGIAEVIDDPDDGLLAPPDNANLFVDHVSALISNRELAMGIAIKARAKIECRFSVERLTAAVESIYDRHLL
ncbi:glycosyltransferase [bacterium]|nr:glycosyltransferase [bacterium]